MRAEQLFKLRSHRVQILIDHQLIAEHTTSNIDSKIPIHKHRPRLASCYQLIDMSFRARIMKSKQLFQHEQVKLTSGSLRNRYPEDHGKFCKIHFKRFKDSQLFFVKNWRLVNSDFRIFANVKEHRIFRLTLCFSRSRKRNPK